MGIEMLKGVTLRGIDRCDDELMFEADDGRTFRMWHRQDCCESVFIESIVGDINDLIGTPILLAEEVSSSYLADIMPIEERVARRMDGVIEDSGESETWTFYKLATRKGYVDIRWYGTSNGYYSETVDFEEVAFTQDNPEEGLEY